VAAQFLSGSMPRVPVTVAAQSTPPTATLQGPTDGVRGQARTFTFAATSASAAEQAAGFTYTINWGDGSPVQTVARTPGNGAGVTVSHVFTDSGTYPVTVTATDQDGHTSAPVSQTVTITPWEIQTQPDPVHAGKTIQVLVVGGSTGADDIAIDRGPHGRGIEVVINQKGPHKQLEQLFTAPIDRIVVYGQAGNDSIVVSDDVKQTSELYGGDGNDTLAGGGGDNILVGGDGNDLLSGGRGRNLMIGGAGKDELRGGCRGDILIGGTTDYDANEVALRALLAEWTSADSYKARVDHIFGTLGGGLNGSYHLNADTVHDDGARDELSGGDGRDWFLVGANDKVKDRRHHERVTHV
jgi:Ca2+-binding RTX toxin-like protein